jgi:glycosyltransferase involved in cell wall biosynthesis
MQGLASVWLAKRTKPVVVQLVGDPLMALRHALRKPWGTLAGLVAGTLVGEAIRRADGAIFVSHALKRKYWTPGPQPVCVANESRIPEAWVCGEKHVHLRSVDTPLRLVFAGRLSPEKGLDVLLRALAGTPGVSLTVIGAGPQTPKLEALARALTVDNRVCFAGGQPWNQSLLRYIGTHDALVLPSFTEGLPLVLAEAMSQAIPVIATRVGGIPEIVTHGVNGLLVPPGDLPRLAEAICALRDDPGLYSILASNARRTALENTTEVQYGRAAEFILNIWRQKTSEGGADSGGSNA